MDGNNAIYKWIASAVGLVVIFVCGQLIMRSLDVRTKKIDSIVATQGTHRERISKIKLQVKAIEAWREGIESELQQARGRGFHVNDGEKLENEMKSMDSAIWDFVIDIEHRQDSIAEQVASLHGGNHGTSKVGTTE